MKDIVIIADFCGNLDGKGNNRFIYLANMLKKDNKVEVVTSDFSHGKKAYFECKPQFDFDITMLHEPVYSKNVCLKRFYSHYVWGKNVAEYLKTRKKPDVVYCALPTFYAGYMAAKYCEQNDVRFIIDIQDLWPEAFQMVFKIPLISDIAFAPFRWLANQSYKRADEIVAVSQTYVDRALRVNKKCKQGYPVFLGTNLADFDDNVRNNPVATKPPDEVWLGYCGTLGASYDLISVFEALRMVKNRGVEPPKFIVMGSGPRAEEFKQRAEGLNVEFTGNLPYPQMCGMLAACDMVVNPIKGRSAASIINKHADYAASGLPVLNTQESEEYRKLVEGYNMGFNCVNGDAVDLANKILILLNDSKLRKDMGRNARRCAEELFDRGNSYRKIVELL